MGTRGLGILGLLGGGGLLYWLLYRDEGGGVYAPIAVGPDDLGPIARPSSPPPAAESYLTRMSLAEAPNQDPYVKNPYSSASGLYQFTKATWTALGGDWGNDPSKAFGGLRPSIAEQTARAQRLTAENAGVLQRAGQAVNSLTLYAVHIFGPKAVDVLQADRSTRLADLVGASTVAKNPALGQTVGSFWNYLQRKVG